MTPNVNLQFAQHAIFYALNRMCVYPCCTRTRSWFIFMFLKQNSFSPKSLITVTHRLILYGVESFWECPCGWMCICQLGQTFRVDNPWVLSLLWLVLSVFICGIWTRM